MPLTPLPGEGIELPLSEYNRLRAFQGGGWFWDHENQQVIRAVLGDFLPRVEERTSGTRGGAVALFQHFVNGSESAGKSVPVGAQMNRVPRAEYDRLQRALETLKRKAEDPHTDPNARRVIEKFRLPDPIPNPELYRLHGPAWNRRLLVLWGCEHEQGTSLPPAAALGRVSLEPASALFVRRLPLWLFFLGLLLLLAVLGYEFWPAHRDNHAVLAQNGPASPSVAGGGQIPDQTTVSLSPSSTTGKPGFAGATGPASVADASNHPAASLGAHPDQPSNTAAGLSASSPPPSSPSATIVSTPTPDAASGSITATPDHPPAGSPPYGVLTAQTSPGNARPTNSPNLRQEHPLSSDRRTDASSALDAPSPSVASASQEPPTSGPSSDPAAPSPGSSPPPGDHPAAAPPPGTPFPTPSLSGASSPTDLASPSAAGSPAPALPPGTPPTLKILNDASSNTARDGKLDLVLVVSAREADGTLATAEITQWNVDGTRQHDRAGRDATGSQLALTLSPGKHKVNVVGTAHGLSMECEAEVNVQIKSQGDVTVRTGTTK